MRMRTAASKARLGQNVASLKVSAPTKFFLLLDYLLKALPSQKFAVYVAFSHVRDVKVCCTLISQVRMSLYSIKKKMARVETKKQQLKQKHFSDRVEATLKQ